MSAGPLQFHPVTPFRVTDTRHSKPMAHDETRPIKVHGLGGIPAEAKAVVVQITVAGPTGSGALSAFANGTSRPHAPTLTFLGGESAVGHGAVVPLSQPDGMMAVHLAIPAPPGANTHVAIDATGYFV